MMGKPLTKEAIEQGKRDFQEAVGHHLLTRRDFMKGAAAGAATLPVAAALYFGYARPFGGPVKAGLIGAGNEGGVLVSESTPEALEYVAYSDIRPSNQARIRQALKRKYGSRGGAAVQFHENYHELLRRNDVEAVVIALPLHLHHEATMAALEAGKHVLCEKLMAWNVRQCKEMVLKAREKKLILSIGHQRHYSLLYAHANEVLETGEIGDIRHIRALWHRNNTWPKFDADGRMVKDAKGRPLPRDVWMPDIPDEDRKYFDAHPELLKKYGYRSLNELVRWRLYERTGGGLMAELGSHQLDACSIFLGKKHPLRVAGVGGKYYFTDDREVDDHVFCTFEFPGKNYDPKASRRDNDIVIVTYSSINTNSFEPYGECVMGSRGTLMVEAERDVILLKEQDPRQKSQPARPTTVTVSKSSGDAPLLDSSATTGLVHDAVGSVERGKTSVGPPPHSRGYREEMDDFAFCIRLWQKGENDKDNPTRAHDRDGRPLPRCHGEVGLADAVIALTANLAMRTGRKIDFDPDWFDADKPAVPDGGNA